MKVKSDHRSKFFNLSNWKEEAWKNQGFNGIRNRDLRDTDWERGQLIKFISSRENEVEGKISGTKWAFFPRQKLSPKWTI